MQLKDYISKVCEIIGEKLVVDIEFELGLESSMEVNEFSKNRIKVKVHNTK